MAEKILFKFSTPHGDYYSVTESGNIIRHDIPGFQPSGQWKFKGLTRTNGSGYLAVPFENLLEWLKRKPELSYKNGNPRYTVVDFDHGTTRVWGNTKYHGVRSIWAESEGKTQ